MRGLQSLVDLASDAALAIDGISRIVAWNGRARSLLGYTPEEALGQPCGKILQATLPNGELLCKPQCDGKRCFEQRKSFGAPDCCLRHKDGWWMRATISTLVAPAPSNRGGTYGLRAIVLLRPRDEGALHVAPSDGRLQVFTFGRFSLNTGGRNLPIDRWYRRHALTLLKILVTSRRGAVHREHLIACLWPNADERRGRQRLKVVTYFLREQLRAAGIADDIVSVADSTYALNCERIWLDCEWFEKLFEEGRRLARRARRQEALACFEKAAQLYCGDYLPGDLYSEWCAEERERLRESHFDVLGHIIDGHLEQGNYEEAAVVCRRGLVDEPCRERFHRALMICLARLGQHDRLISHYDHCCKVLKAELGVGVTPETERLFRKLSSAG